MPCGMQTIRFDRTENNKRLKEIGDILTRDLDEIREAIVSGETPDFSLYATTCISEDIERIAGERNVEISGPSEGILTDAALLNAVKNLDAEFVRLASEWRIDKCESIMDDIIEAQIEHRKEDLKRLIAVFCERWEPELIALVAGADATQPLEPQLGFDPDSY